MRPGPGLVVMALAFISGARRGSTSSINSKTTTTTSSPPLPPQPQPQILSTTTPLTSSPTLYHNIPTTTTYPTSSASALTFPSTSTSYVTGTSATTTTSTPFTGTSDLITSTSSSVTQQINKFYKNLDFYTSKLAREQLDEQHYSLHKRAEEPERFNFFNTFFIRNSYNSYPSASNYFIYTHPLPSHLRHFYEDKRARVLTKSVLHKHKRRRRRKRRTFSDNFDYKGSGTENLKEFDDTLTTAADNSSVDQTTLIRGLPVHFSPLTAADSSSTFDEDDIFALVAEDDLLSEESFDHLVKLTNDKIGDTNEEDYSSGTESVVESASSGSGSGSDSESDSVSGALDNLPDTSHGQNLIQHFVRTLQPPPTHAQDEQLQLQLQLHKQNEHSQLQDDVSDIAAVDVDVDDDLDDVGGNEQPNDNHGSEKNAVHAIYNAHLVGNSNEGVVLLTEADSTHSITPPNTNVQVEQKQITTTSSSIHTKKAELVISVNRYHTILKSSFALTRLNPWISACDLAQPGPISAPDLQGECLAGTLPVAWVAEGPGPPTCLKSCKEETPFTNKLNKDNMINYLFKNNSSINNNINNNNKKNKNKNDSKLNKLVGYTTTTNTFNIKLRNSQPTISDSINTNNNNNNNKNNKINNSKNIDTNKKNNNNNNNIIHKLLNPFNYYQINNSHKNNKMLKKRRNLKETSSAASNGVDIKLNTTMNMTPRYELEEAQSKTLSLHSTSEDYELMLHNMLMQQDGAAANQQIKRDTHQLKQQQQQQQQNLNNNVVKMKLTTAIYNDNNSQHNNQNKQIEMKYNFVRQDHAVNSNSDSDSRYQSNNINNSKKRSSISLSITTTTATTIDNSPVAYNQYLKISTLDKTKEQQQQQQQKQQQQQCLEYLGDSDKTMPTHLCHLLTPSERLAQLRYLRLRNCCERNVYSTLHTLALNATLSGGAGCLSVLQDLMDLDALASRITCGLTEILFRFDCRQVYSIIHQCDDCKEAYRRWVCSTLVPYFAETNDIMKPPEILISTTESISASSSTKSDGVYSPSRSLKSHESSLNNNHSSNDTTMASNMTTSHTTAALPNNSNNNSFIINNNNNNNDTNTDTNKDMSSVMPLKTITSNFITNNNNNQNEMQYVANNYQKKFYLQQQQQEQHHVKKRNIQQQPQHQQQLQPIINHKFINKKKNNITNDIKSHSKFNEFYYKTHLIHHENQPQQQQQHLQQQQLHTTSKAITFNDIVTPNSLTLSPTPSLHQKGNVNGTKLQSFGVHNLQQKSTNKRQKRSVNSTTTKTKYSNVVANEPSISSIPALSLSSTSALNYKQEQPQQQKQQQSFKFISTANNEDSFYEENPVITKLLKRTKRKEFEFRKRRRIRPCLSVCQTVEQKCPYLLPADRAPSMPTQYAGEPTFLCLDYNVAETDEQLKKASHGPNECCYTYCSTTANGICTYCDDMWDKTEIDKAAEILSEKRELKVFNITMKTKGQTENTATIRVESKIQQKMGETVNHVKMSTVAIVVRNDTAFENATRLAERLQYYAFCDGIFYYDDDSNDMPEYPHSESCRKLPPVQSRCSIPYYATNYISSADMLGSHRKNNEAQKLLLWLSTLLCLWSCYSARSMRLKRYNEGKTDQQPNNLIDISYKGLNKMCQKCQTPEIMQHKQHEFSEKIFHFWYDYRESRAFIICLLKMKTSNKSEQIKKKCKSVREKDLLVRYLKQNLKSLSVKMNLNIFKIPTMIVLINYKEIFLLLLFKKRQKLRKRKAKCLAAAAAAVATKTKKMFLLGIVRYASFNNLKSKAKKNSFNKNKIFYKLYYYYYCYYYYYYYYDYGYDYDYDYCSCSTIFSCSANENIIKNNNNYYYYKKKFIYNFSTCNFKYTNNNTEYRNINHNKIRIIEFNCKLISIIKFSTTKTTITATHIFIINYYNNNSNKNKNKINCFTIIIKKSYNNLKCSNSYKKQQKIFKNVLISNPIHRHNHHHHNRHLNYYNNHHNYNGYYNRFIVKSQNMINNKFALPETCKFTCYTLTLMLTSTVTYENEFYNLLKSNMINNIIMLLMIIMMALEMLKIFIMPLLFKSFLKMTHNNINNNNNHHLNYNTIKFTPNFSPNTSYNSNYVIYCYFYYYNFNINDWWQRRHKWWRRRRRPFLQHVIDNTRYHYSTESLFQSGLKSQVQLYPKILL